MGEFQEAKQLGEGHDPHALDHRKRESDSDNEQTYSKYQTASKQIKAWALRNPLVRLSQITPDALDHWKGGWKLKAKHPDDRIGKTTAA